MKVFAPQPMQRSRRLIRLAFLLTAAAAVATGCEGAKTSDPTPPAAAGSATGTSATTAGATAAPSASTSPTSSTTSTSSAPSAATSSPTASTSATSSTSATAKDQTAKKDEGTKKAPTEADVPDDLKSEGYLYYGLGYSKPMKMEITESDQPGVVRSGVQTIKLKEIKDGIPIYSIERTGDLAALGSQEVRLEKDALYNSASTVAKIGPHDIEMPAKLPLGSTWTSHLEVEGDEKMTSDSVYKVLRYEKVKTPVGEQEALLITSSGTATIKGKKVNLSSKQWFVKGKGNVKLVLTKTGDVEKSITYVIQEVK